MTLRGARGEVLSLIGPNGAGKTSAFNAITGYVEPAGGDIDYRGTSPRSASSPIRSPSCGVVRTFQKTSVFTGQTVFDNVLIGLHLRSRQKPARHPARPALGGTRGEAARGRGRRDPALRRPRGARRPAWPPSLPYGELRLLEVAVALAARPKLLLLDEPVSGMNPSETTSFMKTAGAHPRARHHRAAGRARHEDGDGRVRPRHLPQPRPHHRQRHAGEIQRNPEVVRAYLGREVRPCSRLRASPAATARSRPCASCRSRSARASSSR